jgi:hypothetical protein
MPEPSTAAASTQRPAPLAYRSPGASPVTVSPIFPRDRAQAS